MLWEKSDIILCYITLHWVINHVTLCLKWCNTVLHYVVRENQCYIMLYCDRKAMLHYERETLSHYVILCYVTLCYISRGKAMLRYIMFHCKRKAMMHYVTRGILFSFLFLMTQCFGRYALPPSSGDSAARLCLRLQAFRPGQSNVKY